MAQQVKDPMLSLRRCGFNLWPQWVKDPVLSKAVVIQLLAQEPPCAAGAAIKKKKKKNLLPFYFQYQKNLKF